MAEFSVNPKRFDSYKNFKFRIKWDGRYVAGISKISGLRRTTEVVQHREGGDPSSSRKSPGRTEYAPLTLERGVTHDPEFENWANKVWSVGAGLGTEVSLKDFRKDPPRKSTDARFRNIKYFPTSTPMRVLSLSSRSSWRMRAGNETIPLRSRSSRLSRNLNGTVIRQAAFPGRYAVGTVPSCSMAMSVRNKFCCLIESTHSIWRHGRN